MWWSAAIVEPSVHFRFVLKFGENSRFGADFKVVPPRLALISPRKSNHIYSKAADWLDNRLNYSNNFLNLIADKLSSGLDQPRIKCHTIPLFLSTSVSSCFLLLTTAAGQRRVAHHCGRDMVPFALFRWITRNSVQPADGSDQLFEVRGGKFAGSYR